MNDYHIIVNTAKEAINIIPDEWQAVKFKDVFCNYKYGPRFSSKDYDGFGNVKTIRGTDVSSVGKIKYSQVPVARLDKKLVDNNKLHDGDLVMITTADCGITAVFYEQSLPYIASAYAIRLIPSKSISSEYIKFFMQTSYAKKQVEGLVRKGTVANLPGSDVMTLDLNLPPLPEQQKIVAILTSVDDVIEKTQLQINKLKDLKIGMMQELLTRGVGVDGKPHTEFKDSSVGCIPKGWDVLPLGEKVSLLPGYAFKSTDFVSTGVSLIRMGNLYNNELNLLRAPKYLPENFIKKYSKFCVYENDIVFSMTGTAGKEDYGYAVQIPKGTSVCLLNQRVAKVIVSDQVEPSYLLHLMHSRLFLNEIYSIGGGTKQANLSSKDILSVILPFPLLNEQQKISKALDSIDSNINRINDKLKKLRFNKKALMQDLLTGKVRVNVD